ncbi:MAG TPA: transporter [Desulfobacteraceae bacterium]|nr:transporter [Desulfobacteraceae bacterium]
MDIANILIQTLGGLGLFIFGMKMMTEGLQATAGQRIRSILEAISSNRIMGCLTGAGVTAMVQSSSATTVMLIGFVSAGIMTLQQAVGVVIGANVGTTITGQLIAFKLAKAALPAITLGVGLKYFSKRRQFRHIGDIILGFGLLFFGMTVMKNGLAPIKTDPQFISFFTTFTTDTVGGLLLCVSMGALLTVAVQSSSATVGLTMTLASSGLLTFPTALALVLGENIGTTVTAQLATLGSKNTEAHRTANAHTIFNVAGVCLILTIFPAFTEAVVAITGHLGAGPVDLTVNREYPNAARYIANGHTLFNVVNALVFLVFLPKLVKLTIFLSPKDKRDDDIFRLPEFDKSFMDSPIGALARVKGEIVNYAEYVLLNIKRVSTCLEHRDEDILAERNTVEEKIDDCQKIIISYLTTIYQGEVNEPEAKEISEMMRITNNIERIGDAMENISKMLDKSHAAGIHFSQTAREDLKAISHQANAFLKYVIQGMRDKPEDFYDASLAMEDRIDQMRETMRSKHIQRLRNGECSVDAGVFFIAMVSSYEKMGDYCYNVATGINRIL